MRFGRTVLFSGIACSAAFIAAPAWAANIAVDFDTNYSAGNIGSQPSSGTAWSSTSTAGWSVDSSTGVTGNSLKAINTGSSGTALTATYSLSALGTSTTNTKVDYSFSLKVTNPAQTSAGPPKTYGTNANVYLYLDWASSSNYGASFKITSNNSGGFSLQPNLAGTTITPTSGAYHTVSGTIDYTANSFTVSVDGGTAASYTYGGAGGYVNSSNAFGAIYLQNRYAVDANSAQVYVDDFSLTSSPAPEPVGISAMSAMAALGLLRRRRS